jgi:hypothetical protein
MELNQLLFSTGDLDCYYKWDHRVVFQTTALCDEIYIMQFIYLVNYFISP